MILKHNDERKVSIEIANYWQSGSPINFLTIYLYNDNKPKHFHGSRKHIILYLSCLDEVALPVIDDTNTLLSPAMFMGIAA